MSSREFLTNRPPLDVRCQTTMRAVDNIIGKRIRENGLAMLRAAIRPDPAWNPIPHQHWKVNRPWKTNDPRRYDKHQDDQ